MSEVIEKQGWCPDHYCYFVEAEGCDTCNYESEQVFEKTEEGEE